MYKCAVLLATYNGENYVVEQIKSILNQLDVKVHLFISDDGSTDRTVDLIKQVFSDVSRFEFVSRTGENCSAAQNFFSLIRNVDLSSFDYVAFADQDDIWFSDKLSSGIDQMQKNNAVAFSSDVLVMTTGKADVTVLQKSFDQTEHDYWFESPGPGCTQIFRSQEFKLFQTFLISNQHETAKIDYHDWFVYAFYRYNGFKWVISKNPKMYYRQHASNQIGANIGFTAMYKRFQLMTSGWYRQQIEITHKIVTNSNSARISNQYIIKNIFKLRRSRPHSILVALMLLLKLA